MNPQTVESILSALQPEPLVELTSQMVRIPSVNPRDASDCVQYGIQPGEAELVQFLKTRLEASGLEVELQEAAPGRCNLIATLRGRKPGRRLTFNGHTDTVGAFEMGKKAFLPEVREGRLYGRGSVDMKGALACFVLALETLARLNLPLEGEVVLTAVIGEEGPPSGSDFLVQHGFTTDGIIVGEASECQVFLGQRGSAFIRLFTHGKSGHGSMPHSGVNAIDQMVRLLAAIPEMELFNRDCAPYGKASRTVGTIEGGVRTNIIPEACNASIDIRIPPGIQPQEVLSAFTHQIEALGINGRVEPVFDGSPAYLTPRESPLALAARSAALQLGLPGTFGLAPYWSDLAYFASSGTPALIIGPGSILQAHSDLEYVETDQLTTAARLYALTALAFCQGG